MLLSNMSKTTKELILKAVILMKLKMIPAALVPLTSEPLIKVSLISQPGMKKPLKLLLPLMLPKNLSSSTLKVSMLNLDAAVKNWIMVYWPLVMVLIRRVISGSSKTRGEQAGEMADTSKWLVIAETNVVLLALLVTLWFRSCQFEDVLRFQPLT